MHIASYTMARQKTIPSLRRFRDAIAHNSKRWADDVEIGRTHLEDVRPLTVGQEWSASRRDPLVYKETSMSGT
jgi:fumarate hydratase class II